MAKRDESWRYEPEARRRDQPPVALPRHGATQHLSLFDAPPEPAAGITPRARNTDPQTSHDAAMSVEPKLRDSQLAVLAVFRIRARDYGNDGMTDKDLVSAYSVAIAGYYHECIPGDVKLPAQSVSGLRTRRKELVAMGYLRDSGRRLRRGRDIEEVARARDEIIWELVPTP